MQNCNPSLIDFCCCYIFYSQELIIFIAFNELQSLKEYLVEFRANKIGMVTSRHPDKQSHSQDRFELQSKLFRYISYRKKCLGYQRWDKWVGWWLGVWNNIHHMDGCRWACLEAELGPLHCLHQPWWGFNQEISSAVLKLGIYEDKCETCN